MTYSFLKQHSELVDDHLTIDVIVSCYKEKPAQRPEQGQILRPVHSVPYADNLRKTLQLYSHHLQYAIIIWQNNRKFYTVQCDWYSKCVNLYIIYVNVYVFRQHVLQ